MTSKDGVVDDIRRIEWSMISKHIMVDDITRMLLLMISRAKIGH